MSRLRSRAAFVVAALTTTAIPAGCGTDTGDRTTTRSTAAVSVERLTVRVPAAHPHDAAGFTEGLLVDRAGRMFESVGQYGQSAIREVNVETGAVIHEHRLDAGEFGEGIAEHDGTITQLTWQQHVAHRWSVDGLAAAGSATFDGEGWGLAFDPSSDRFLQSNGSSTLTWRSPSSFAPVGTIAVRLDGKPVDQLNELEIVDGQVLANVWHSDQIMRIDPASGVVTAVIDAGGLWPSAERSSEMVLNGIAHRPGDPATHLLLTGKNWPSLYEVDVVTAPTAVTSTSSPPITPTS